MRASLVGTGYVGIVTGACFAHAGHDVIMVDNIKEKVDAINAGKSPIYENGLEEMISEEVRRGRLKGTTNLREAVEFSDITFICVGTPALPDGSQNLAYVKAVAEEIGDAIAAKDTFHTVVVKSTVAPGTTLGIVKPILEKRTGMKAGEGFGLGMNPEFLKEGDALNDFLKPDRIVYGYVGDRAAKMLRDIYAPFSAPVVEKDCTTAEMIKYASNSLLAARVALIDEIGNICKALGIDVRDVAAAAGMDRRIGPHFLHAGIGFGGSCFRKDVSALAWKGGELGVGTPILHSVIAQNDAQPLRIVEMLTSRMDVAGRRIGVLGLSFKPETDDIRDAPSIIVVRSLLEKGASVVAYDPMAEENFSKLFPQVSYAKNASEVVASTDSVLVLTEWKEFADPSLYGDKPVFDGRGVTRTSNYEGVCW